MSHDSKLQQAVLAEFEWEPCVTAAHIGVTAHAGVVTLTGHVGTHAEKLAAETVACRVEGVQAMANEIEVRLPCDMRLSMGRSDEEIAVAAIDRLTRNTSVPRNSVKVRVEKGWVTLSGRLDWHYQREAAEQTIRPLFGVVGVSNQTTIKPEAKTLNLSDDIMVNAERGRVLLAGTVHAPHERQVTAATT